MRFWLAAAFAALIAACAAAPPSALPPMAAEWLNSAVILEAAGGHGSGTVVGQNLILTAGHVAAHSDGMFATFHDGTARPVRVIWRGDDEDIALLSFDGEPHGAIVPVSCQTPAWGQRFWWVGNPMFLRWVLRSGYVASVDPDGIDEFSAEISATGVPVVAQFSRGDSGSGTISDEGYVIGVVVIMVGNGSNIGGIAPTSAVCDKLRVAGAVKFLA